MASSDLQTVIDMLKSANPLGSLDIQQMRAGMAVAETVYERPGDVSYEPVDARGVPPSGRRRPAPIPRRRSCGSTAVATAWAASGATEAS